MKKLERTNYIMKKLNEIYPTTPIPLNHKNNYELLVAVLLSAQCTDERVNTVTPGLFSLANTAVNMQHIPIEKIYNIVRPCGLAPQKSKAISNLSKILVEKYGGEVPGTMDALVKLPGVGRKTANVVLGNIFDVPGVVVDTHVTRITNLLGFTKSKNAVVIERELEKIIEEKDWTLFTHLIIDHGRAICVANRPNCTECSISSFCPSSI